ncbi:MAG: zf-TFIIB domain-containing protein [Acidobacteriota bacterium]
MKLIACQECKRQWDVSRYRVGQRLRCTCGFVMEVPRLRSYTSEVHHCQACGAARSDSSTACEYCGAVPARDAIHLSLVCPSCMHRTGKKSKFCSCCGKPIQPATLDAKSGKLPCPRCVKTRLINRKIGEFMVDECPRCAGMWLAAGAFERIVNVQARRQESEYSSAVEKGKPVRARLETTKVVYVKCPRCRRLMNRRNFARASGVIIDECHEHGAWLDSDELGKIAAYVASGGLQYTRQLQAQEAAGKRRVPRPLTLPSPIALGRVQALDNSPLGSALRLVRALMFS